MSGFCGWLDRRASQRPDATDIARMATAVSGFDASAVRTVTCAWGGVVAAAAAHDGDVSRDEGHLVAVWGKVKFTDPELATLAGERGAGGALVEGYRRRGTAILDALTGSFALAILERHGSALLAVDRSGTRPLYYEWNGARLNFASTLDAVRAITNLEVSRQALYDYVYCHMVPGPQTVYKSCERLLPGTFLAWNRGTIKKAPYWQPRFTEDQRRPFPGLKQEFRTLVRKSVAHAIQSGERTGAFLSGGTDSSTLAGMLREVTGEAARTYSIGFDARGYDEMAYARIAARHFATQHHEYYVTPNDVVAAIPRIAQVHDQPFGNSSSVPAYYCAKLAREDGIELLLAGDGGDELFAGNARYVKQYLYSLYSDLPSGLRKGLIEPVASALPRAMFGKVQRYISNASQPMPARYDNYNLVERLGAFAVFAPEFLETVDPGAPAAQMASIYWSQNAQCMVNRMLGFDLKYTLADNDLPKVMRSCELAGVKVCFPMLDDALVAFATALPPNLKMKGTRLRYFFKEALRGFLPDEVLGKTKHGFGLPFGPWLMAHEPLREIAFDSLNDLKQRCIVRREFIDELISTHVRTHAQYFGTMVWVLMMLEQWFKRSGSACSSRRTAARAAETTAQEAK